MEGAPCVFNSYCLPAFSGMTKGPRLDGTYERRGSHPFLQLTGFTYADLPLEALEIGFRLARPAIGLSQTSHHDRVFEVAFSIRDDEVIADAVCAWIADSGCTPVGSLISHLADRAESTTPFLPRLRQMAIHAIHRIWSSELAVSALETVRLLDRLEVDVDDMDDLGEGD